MRKYYANLFMAPDGDGQAGAAGANAGSTTGAMGDIGGGNSGAGGGGNAGATGTTGASDNTGTSALGNAAPQQQPHERFPEKFRVFKEDKSFDLEATAVKQAEAYTGLEKKLGTGDTAPATVAEYKFENLGEGIDAAEVMKDPMTQAFLARAHAKGLTNAQAQDVMAFALNDWLPKLVDGSAAVSEQDCIAELKKTWADDASYTANMAVANKAFQAFADPADRARIDEIGNNPLVVKLLANIGKEMREDAGVSLETITGGKSIEELMMDPAYTDTKNPNHARVSAQVKRYYESKHGTAAVM